MNKHTAKLFAYAISVGLFIVFVVLAIFDRVNRLGWLVGAFVFLGFGWLVERLFSRKGVPRERKKEMCSLGSIDIDGQLTISDQLALSESQVLGDLPKGLYSVSVETWSDRHDSYVAAIIITGPPAWQAPRRYEVKLTVDTGFLVFAGAEKSEELLQRVKDAQSRILSDEYREVDVETFVVGEKIVGFVTSTGYGDGQYSLKLRVDENSKPEIVCRFIDEP